ncbi:uncharacterized protein LOC117217569 [Megalopta genalis]|uniref:uncharacterized protein LOC117217569 n=1 Tax=Megalopta genalis TaxID=115081 RepID=UPI003FD14EDD
MTMVISTSPANRCISSVNCACCASLLNRKSKLAESTACVRRKRWSRHCLFRHCSGIVCAKKLLKRKRKRSCTHMRVSQDTITDFWNFCVRNINDESRSPGDNVLVPKSSVGFANLKNGDTRIADEREEKIQKNCCCNGLHENLNSVETEANPEGTLQENGKCTDEVSSKLCIDEENSKREVSRDFVDKNMARSSDQQIEVLCKEQNCFNSTPKQVLDRDITDSRNVNAKTELAIDSNKCDYTLKENRKESKSETSFSETIIADTCMDTLLYRELRTKRAPKMKKKAPIARSKSSKSIESKLTNGSEKAMLLQNSNTDDSNTPENCSQPVFVKETHKHSSEYSATKPSATSGLQNECLRDEFETTCFNAYQASTISQKKVCRNCSHSLKSRSRPRWSIPKKGSSTKFNSNVYKHCKTSCKSSHPQKNNFSNDNGKFKRIADSMLDRESTLATEKCFLKCKTPFSQNEKKITANMSKNRKYEDSTILGDSSSAISSESSDSDSRAALRRPLCKSRMHNQHDHDHASSSNLFPWKRCPSCTVLFEYSACKNGQSVSNAHKRKRDQRIRGSPTSTSSTSSVSTSISREACAFRRNNADRNMHILFRKSNRIFDEEAASVWESRNRPFEGTRLYEQDANNRTMYTDERRVKWGFKRAY